MDHSSANSSPAPIHVHELRELLQYWRQEHNARARGGWWALAGFSYQTSLFLMHFFQRIESSSDTPDSIAAMEGLSDILCPDDGRYYLIQAKRRLTKGSLSESLEEAYLITSLCLKKTPGLLQHLRFQIACRTKATPLGIGDIDLQPVIGEEFDPHTYQAMFSQFDADEPIVKQADPLDQLYLYLWNAGIADPATLVTRCHGELLEGFGTHPVEHGHLAWKLNGHYRNAHRRDAWSPVGNVLTSRDVEPYPDAESLTDILINDVARLEHLRRGCLREREAIFAPLWSDFEQWLGALDEMQAGSPDRIQTFWVSGRSGEGKSVLLLQLLARWLTTSPGLPILHLKSGRDLVSLLNNPPAYRVFAFVDDLYDVPDRDQWSEDLRDACALSIPNVTIVTCGPTEQMHLCVQSLNGLLDIHSYEIPHFGEEERREFIEWFRKRTGKDPNPKNVTTDNAMLVQFMFELAQGTSMSAFAESFSKRLKGLGMFDEARAILAVNALYLDAPLDILKSDEVRDRLELLCAKNQLHFRYTTFDEFGRPTSVRMAHAHLAWLLFVAWVSYPTPLSKAWARELEDVIARTEDKPEHQYFPGNLLRSLLSSTHLSVRDDSTAQPPVADQRALLRELYAKHTERHGGSPTALTLPRWLELVYKVPGLELAPDPVTSAVALMSDADKAAHCHGSVARWLWLISESRMHDEKSRLQEIVKSFLMAFPDNPGIVNALLGAVSRCQERRLNEYAVGWMKNNKKHPQAYRLLQSLVARNPGDDELRSLALGWLDDNKDHLQAHHVLAPLVAANPGDDELRSLALRWLDGNKDHLQAYQLLAPLVSTNPGDDELRSLALDWLQRNEDHRQAYKLIEPLVARNPGDDELLNVALRWLQENKARPEAYTVIAPLVARNPEDDELRSLALGWLGDNKDHPQAYWLIAPLVARNPEDDELRSLALGWLGDNKDHPQAYQLVAPLLAANPDDSAVQTLTVNWLSTNREHPGYSHVLRVMIARSDGAEEWLSAGVEYINRSDARDKHSIVAVLATASKATPYYVELGYDLVDSRTDTKANGWVLKNIGRALAWHPENAVHYLNGPYSEDRKRYTCYNMVRGMKRYPDTAAGVVAVLGDMGPFYVSFIISSFIRQGVDTPETDAAVADWLNANRQHRGYVRMLRELTRNSEMHARLTASDALSSAVLSDLTEASHPTER